MSEQSGLSSSRLQFLFEAAIQDYEKKTGIVLARHPLAEKLQNCHSVESVTAVFYEQTQAFGQFRGGDKVLKPLKSIVSVLHKLSAAADTIGLVCLGDNRVLDVSDPHLIACPARESGKHLPCCPTLCMCFA